VFLASLSLSLLLMLLFRRINDYVEIIGRVGVKGVLGHGQFNVIEDVRFFHEIFPGGHPGGKVKLAQLLRQEEGISKGPWTILSKGGQHNQIPVQEQAILVHDDLIVEAHKDGLLSALSLVPPIDDNQAIDGLHATMAINEGVLVE